jgi:excisionase family DNA binding protein
MMLTPPTIAKQLAVKPEKVVAWIRAGKLRAVDLGDGKLRPRFRVPEEALADFLAGRAVQPPTRPGRRPRATPDYPMIYPEV